MRYDRILVIFLGIGILGAGIFWWVTRSREISFKAPIAEIIEKPLEKYSFERLREGVEEKSEIHVEEDNLFWYMVGGKKITGQIHLPVTGMIPVKKYPVIVMIRGFVDQEIYRTGMGTEKAAGVLAKNGYVTLAPDFLGYGGSDKPVDDSMAERVMRPYELLVLINSLGSLPMADSSRLGIWGHSNGGQIALSLLEITGKDYPTTLWAPVSKPFPYSILYYTDEFDDKGKALRKAIARFEEDYDADKYSIHQDYDFIQAPIQIHQGTADDAVPAEWSRELEISLKKIEKDVRLYIYPGADHNLKQVWNGVVNRDVVFFNSRLK